MWNVAPVIFEDEDEEKLKADFVALCARYPETDAFEIASYVFRFQRDPELRSQQAAMVWLKDLDIKERIRLAKLNGGAEPSPIPTKEQRMRQLQELFEDASLPLKDRLTAARTIAEMNGDIVKAVDVKSDPGARPRRQIVFAQYDD